MGEYLASVGSIANYLMDTTTGCDQIRKFIGSNLLLSVYQRFRRIVMHFHDQSAGAGRNAGAA
jgi:hypothetical protein